MIEPEAVRIGSPAGREAEKLMKAGQLVPDSVVDALIDARLDVPEDHPGFIFDGYPRTPAQAVALDATLGKRGFALDHVIELSVDEEALVERVVGRFSCVRCGASYHEVFQRPKVAGVCDQCAGTEFKRRPDDNAETVRTRMAEYRAKTEPILPYYEERGLVRRVDGMAEIAEVTEAIERILDS